MKTITVVLDQWGPYKLVRGLSAPYGASAGPLKPWFNVGRKCCLGFGMEQCGIATERLVDIGLPHSLRGPRTPEAREFIKAIAQPVSAELQAEVLALVNKGRPRSTQFWPRTRKKIRDMQAHLNDSYFDSLGGNPKKPPIPLAKVKPLLRRLFKEAGYRLVFKETDGVVPASDTSVSSEVN